jgi:Ca-activated chloride channel family protein
MRLAYPWVLLLALPVLLALAWKFLSGEKEQAALPLPAAPELWAGKPTARALLARWLPAGLKGLALLLVVFALARPQLLSSRAHGVGRGIDIILAVDSSLSMSAVDLSPSRIEAAKETALKFVRGRAQDRIGIITFGGATQLICPLTLDYDAVSSQLEQLFPGITKADGTAIGDGIVSALNHLKGSDAKSRVIILLTDGRSNTGVVDPLTAAKTAASLGVRIYTIGTAKRGQALMPVDDPLRGRMMVPIDDDLDEDQLDAIARAADGRYFRAQSAAELKEIYATIDKLEKSDVKLPDVVSRNDRYHAPVLAAALLLLCEISLANTWLLRWP